jgi:hypothetical protein
VLVSATATTYGQPPRPDLTSRTPDVADAAAQLLHAARADRTTEDLDALGRTNRLVGQASNAGRPDLLTGSTGHPYRQIDVMGGVPTPGWDGTNRRGRLRRPDPGLGRLTDMDNWLVGRAIRGAGNAVGRRDLLSYPFFDEEYFAAGIELGRRTATGALSRGWERWRQPWYP